MSANDPKRIGSHSLAVFFKKIEPPDRGDITAAQYVIATPGVVLESISMRECTRLLLRLLDQIT